MESIRIGIKVSDDLTLNIKLKDGCIDAKQLFALAESVKLFISQPVTIISGTVGGKVRKHKWTLEKKRALIEDSIVLPRSELVKKYETKWKTLKSYLHDRKFRGGIR